jgi:F-type H+-transporting ATPase subunit b
MRKIVKDILEAESRVDDILREARERASQMRLTAEKQVSEKMAGARREAQEIVQTAAEQARVEAERIRAETLKRAERQGADLLGGRAGAVDDLVARICTVVLSTERGLDDQ